MHRIDKQKLYKLPFATIPISPIFADISAIIEKNLQPTNEKFDIVNFQNHGFEAHFRE